MTLTEAITKLSSSPPSKMTAEQVESLGIVLAAARAVNCERCQGTGLAMRKDKPWQVEHLYCPDCHDDRKKAGIV